MGFTNIITKSIQKVTLIITIFQMKKLLTSTITLFFFFWFDQVFFTAYTTISKTAVWRNGGLFVLWWNYNQCANFFRELLIMPTSASRTRRSVLAPFRLSILFLFSRGIFLKLYGAETGLGRASSKEEAVVMKCSGARDFFASVIVQWLKRCTLGIRLGHFR